MFLSVLGPAWDGTEVAKLWGMVSQKLQPKFAALFNLFYF
jgi:hypothetical protein